MSRVDGLILLLATLAAPAAYSTQVVFEYTGVVFASTFPGVAVGEKVRGTYIFDYANANPAFSVGTIGSATPWIVESNSPLATPYVFKSTAVIGGVTVYKTHGPDPSCLSYVESRQAPGTATRQIFATESDPGLGAIGSFLSIMDPLTFNTPPTYTSAGYPTTPLPGGYYTEIGGFEQNVNPSTHYGVSYVLTKLTRKK